jgi:hypothetical protein
MKNKLLILTILFILPLAIFSQTVSPSETDEFCPVSLITFTVSLGGNHTSDASVSMGTYVTQGFQNTPYYNFATDKTYIVLGVYFSDVNQDQSFTLDYGGSSHHTFTFSKIKSLNSTDYSYLPAPSPSSIFVPTCETANISFSFSKVPWVNVGSVPHSTFGQVDDYKYSLPTGWSINGGTPVSGPTDYRYAGNSVTINTDASNGDGGVVRVKAVNSCNTSFSEGTWVDVPVTRGKPHLTFTSVNTICSSNTFQANGVPGYISNYSWTISAPTAFTLSSTTANPITITKVYPAEATLTLDISGSGCAYTWHYNTTEIIGRSLLAGGVPPISTTLPIYYGPGDEYSVCLGEETTIPFTSGSLNTPTWTEVSHVGSPAPSWNGNNTEVYMYFFNSHSTSIVLQVDATNACGTSSYQFGFASVGCFRGMVENNYLITPNPAKGQVENPQDLNP